MINKSAIKAEYLSANARQLQSLYDYQRVVLNAFTEVVTRMSKVDNYGQSMEIKKQQLVSLEASVDNATQLFQNARAEYVEVLLAQRELMQAAVAALGELSPEDQEALVATFWEEATNVTGATLRKRRERALKRLRDTFKRLYGLD